MSPRAIMMRLVGYYRRDLLEFGEWDRGAQAIGYYHRGGW